MAAGPASSGGSKHEHRAAPDHDVRRVALAESIRNGLWFIPTMAIAAAAVVAVLLIHLSESTGFASPVAFRGDADVAQVLLTTVAGATLTMTTLVVSITIVALQLASQQFSPRVMRTFFRDTGTKVAIGIFLATTAYALLVLRAIEPGSDGSEPVLPHDAITFAFVLMLASLVTLLYFLNHVAHSIRAVHIIEAVAGETRVAIRAQGRSTHDLARAEPASRAPDLVLTSEQPPGALLGYDEDDLVRVAMAHRVRLRMLPFVGDYLPSGVPLAEVWADEGAPPPTITAAEVVPFVGLGRERTMRQDVAFGFRQLVDIAEKALSPAINDPTTAVQSLNRIHDLLRRLAKLPDPVDCHRDDGGAVRVEVPVHGWDDLVHLALDEIRQYGADSLQIQRLLRSLLLDLRQVVADRFPERLAVLDLELDLLDRAAARSFPDVEDRHHVARPIYGSRSADPA